MRKTRELRNLSSKPQLQNDGDLLGAVGRPITQSAVEAATTRFVAEAALAAYVADKIDGPRHADPVEDCAKGGIGMWTSPSTIRGTSRS
ncbi:hypothetical protein [Sulfitobacter pontiacus]|uniref:hypothetical protein n=1 Tax=Sulfitobacter pontiacus TaxID=60137 RepID=UPI00274CCBD7|nr:hypothetical protein [Sulfitobacter pontiacus]GLO79876.1 hypothetical protein MACH23_32970 [Sulfitobacter pontiacus]